MNNDIVLVEAPSSDNSDKHDISENIKAYLCVESIKIAMDVACKTGKLSSFYPKNSGPGVPTTFDKDYLWGIGLAGDTYNYMVKKVKEEV